MNVGEYMKERFESFGITLKESFIMEACIMAGIDMGDEFSGRNIDSVKFGMSKIIPSLMARPTSVSESGLSISWDMSGLKAYYSTLCKELGMKDELNTEKPKVRFL